jgi:hypothetical protein
MVLLLLLVVPGRSAAEGTNSFPTLSEVFQGRMFPNKTERDVFFLQAICVRYPSQWPDLLLANLTVQDYVMDPAKLTRFISELSAAMEGRNDLVASTNLAVITSDPGFYANTNAYRPDILKAAAQALMRIGPNGRTALAGSFTRQHYSADPGSLELLASTIGEEHPSSPELASALAATAFDFATTNGGMYPRCTMVAAENLLLLPGGVEVVRNRLQIQAVFNDPGRFEAVADGIAAAAKSADLKIELEALEAGITIKLDTLAKAPGEYRDELESLRGRIRTLLEAPSHSGP